jgi:hypothetical protein
MYPLDGWIEERIGGDEHLLLEIDAAPAFRQ